MSDVAAGPSSSNSMRTDALSDRAARIFEFLIELQRLRTRVVRSIDSYRSVLWFADLPQTPEITTASSFDDADAWLVIDRVERDKPPTPPAMLEPWLTDEAIRASHRGRPELSARAVRVIDVVNADGTTEAATEELLIDEHPELLRILEEWLPEWTAWARIDRQRATVAELYQQLYAVYQESRALAETYEVLLAFGHLVTRSGGQAVRRHLVTTRAAIELDLESGRLTVLPAPDSTALQLEQDMLDPVDAVPDDVRSAVLQALNDVEDPWALEPDGVSGALRTWVNGLSADAQYAAGLEVAPERLGVPVVSFAPALILRERTKRTFIAACQQVVDAVRAGAPVPSGVRQFIEITDGRADDDVRAAWSRAYEDAETYFPKPANDDQRQIVARLAQSQTVVVQGPPGTGKTHTIANLVTDMLAHGQRVLITSTTTRALRVLKDKLPEEISDLCVSVTDDAIKGQADLENSVTTILAHSDEWNQAAAEVEARKVRGRLSAARRTSEEATRELRTIREQETYEYAPEIGDYQGTLQRIAQRLAAEEAELGWLGPVGTDRPNMTGAEAQRFVRLLREATPDLMQHAGTAVAEEQLLPPEDFEALVARRADLEQQGVLLAEARDAPGFEALSDLDQGQRQTLTHALVELSRARGAVEFRTEHWVSEALRDVFRGRARAWRQQLRATNDGVEEAIAQQARVTGRLVTGLEAMDLGVALGYATQLSDHLSGGRKLKGVLGRSKVAKEAEPFLERVRVDGQRCETPVLLDVVLAHIAQELVLRPLEQTWAVGDVLGRSRDQRIARLEDEGAVLSEVIALADALAAVIGILQVTAGFPATDLSDPVKVITLQHALAAVDVEELHHDVEESVEPVLRLLQHEAREPRAAPALSQAVRALEGWDPSAYRAACAGVAHARQANTLIAETARVRSAVAEASPSLVRRIEDDPADAVWEHRLAGFERAWAWSVWDARVRAKTDPSAEARWRQVLTTAEFDERLALKELASNRGWAHCMTRLTPEEQAHLNMYALAIRKVGKGTGKHAERFRTQARESLRHCQSAVPAWIMPMHQVFETVPVDRPDIFDVVIIDEASQSGLEGLLLSWLAPRIVVVGDDKQVSPSNVGLDHEAVFTLQDRYLSGIETKSLFGPQSSFFDQAVGMSRSRVMLREHFRCMPEIIGFSNELSYRGQLLPLRQYGADRLPPLRTTYVKGAMVAGSRDVVNEAEATALVDQVAKCCADPAYDDRTMGVITLLGNAQDKLIASRLVESLGVQEIERRRLRVSNAEGFQGDERHVIFMSMVSSLQSTTGPARIGPFSKESDQQRFNVAASRAQDQVWLFHSVHPGDLSEKDLRRRYLQYVIKPPAEQDALDLGEVLPDVRHLKFDSLFEQRVFLAVRRRGYRVRPQVKAGRYRLDLVVEGGSQRLAVECDGDAFHGADVEMDDVARQRDLERVGWTFWRVRGSTFYRDLDGALEPLWALLEALGIQPASDTDPFDEALRQEVQAQPLGLTDGRPARPAPVVTPETDTSPVLPAPRARIDYRRASRHPSSPPATTSPSATQPRFRDGKVLLSTSAHARVEAEVRWINDWLAAPPTVSAVDPRSRRVQEERQDRLREDLEGRLDFLRRVLTQSIADPAHVGGRSVTPGCLVSLRFGDTADVELCVVSSVDDGEHRHISPFTGLGQSVDGAELSATVGYTTPKGVKRATVVQILD